MPASVRDVFGLNSHHYGVDCVRLTKACVPPNDFQGLKKIGRLCQTKKIGRFFHRFYLLFVGEFFGENR